MKKERDWFHISMVVFVLVVMFGGGSVIVTAPLWLNRTIVPIDPPKAHLQSCDESSYRAVRQKVRELSVNSDSIGSLVEFGSGQLAKVSRVYPDDGGFLSLTGRNGWLGLSQFSAKEVLCSITDITAPSDPQYSQRLTEYLRQMP